MKGLVVGTITQIGKVQEFGNNGFQKREVVITTDEQYPQDIQIEFVQDKCALLDKYRLGETVKININIRGREWTNPQGEVKYFNSIQGWRIEAQPTGSSAKPNEAFEPANNINEEEHDDLPF